MLYLRIANPWTPWRRPFGDLAKVGVEGSNPFARSRIFKDFNEMRLGSEMRSLSFSTWSTRDSVASIVLTSEEDASAFLALARIVHVDFGVEGAVEVCGALLYLRQSAGEHARSQWTCWRTRDNIWTLQIRQLAAIEAGAPIAKPLTRGDQYRYRADRPL